MRYLNCFCALLKQKLLETGFVNPNEIKGYKVVAKNKNLFKEMSGKTLTEFKAGDGGELTDGKMNMIRSSSAMIYNLLGNEDVIINKNSSIPEIEGIYSKKFEKKYKTVNVIVHGKKVEANLDAWLYNESCEIFIESKCLEWIQNSHQKKLSKSYIRDTRKYFYPETAESFRKVGCEITLSQYDSCQMFKHTLAIYNYLKDEGIKNKKIYLLNIVWETNEKALPQEIRSKYRHQLKLEHSEFEVFHKKMKPIIDEINKFQNITFDILYLSVKDFHSMLAYSDEEQKAFVQRYL